MVGIEKQVQVAAEETTNLLALFGHALLPHVRRHGRDAPSTECANVEGVEVAEVE